MRIKIFNNNLFYFELNSNNKDYYYSNIKIIDIGFLLNKEFLFELYQVIRNDSSIQLTTFNIHYLYDKCRFFIDFNLEYNLNDKPYLYL
jgi:hypothetical protein